MSTQRLDLSELALDWKMAVDRFESDVRDDFFPDPLRNRDLFVAAKVNVESVVTLDDYQPESAESWDVPKPNLTLRHCINVTAVDRLVYQALVDHLSAICDPHFSKRCFGYRLRVPPSKDMFLVSYQQFDAYNEAVRTRLLAAPHSFIVTVDVAQYFENLSFALLKEKLIEQASANLGSQTRSIIDVLMECLSRWSPYTTHGLPQNMYPSSFLGNVFLHSLDKTLLGAGYDYYRYMDDIRIIAPDEATARRSLCLAITHLRELELSVNGKKTGIVRPGTDDWQRYRNPPPAEFAEIGTVIHNRVLAELPSCVERLNDMLLRVIQDGGHDHRTLGFCVGRLTAIRRLRKIPVPEPEGAGPSLVRLLRNVPQATPNVCQYLLAGEPTDATFTAVGEMLTAEPLCVYPWQNYHFWLLASARAIVTESLLNRARQIVAHRANSPELAGAAIYLGTVDATAELRPIVTALQEQQYSVTVVRALVTAIQRLLGHDESPSVLSRLAQGSATLQVLENYISRLREPHFLSPPRRVSLRRLAEALPDQFS